MVANLKKRLRDVRLGLFSSLDDVLKEKNSVDLLEWQIGLLEEMFRVESVLSKGRNQEWSEHKKLLRILGDTVVWKILDPYVIRVLARGPHIPPGLASQRKSIEHVLNISRMLVEQGQTAILCDLTRVLRHGDIIASSGAGEVFIYECKDTDMPSEWKVGGRVARQIKKMNDLADFLNHGLGAYLVEDNGNIWLPMPPAAEPAYTWDAVESAAVEAHEEGFSVKVAEPKNIVIGVRDGYTGDLPDLSNFIAPEELESGGILTGHFRLMDESMTYEPPPTCWPISFDIRVALLESDIFLNHVFDPQIFFGTVSDDPRIEIFGLENEALLVDFKGNVFKFGNRFINDVALGYQTLESAKRGCHSALAVLLSDNPDLSNFPNLKATVAIAYRDKVAIRLTADSLFLETMRRFFENSGLNTLER